MVLLNSFWVVLSLAVVISSRTLTELYWAQYLGAAADLQSSLSVVSSNRILLDWISANSWM